MIPEFNSQFHVFATDAYKPEFCSLEQEIRLVAYIANKKDLGDLGGVTYLVSEDNILPNHLYYNFKDVAKQKGVVDIEMVFCRTNNTRARLVELLGEDRVHFISDN